MPSRSHNRMSRLGFCALAAVAVALLAGVAAAQPVDKDQATKNQALLRDFIHFTKIDRPDVAASYARQLLDLKLTPGAFVDLIEQSGEQDRFDEAIAKAMRSTELEGGAADLAKLFSVGKLERVRDPQEIAKSIQMLKGQARSVLLGRERLAAAGEYAMPQLLKALLQRDDPVLQAQTSRLLADMGRQVIIPLATALPGLDPASQETVVDVLGQVSYRTSLPFVFDLMSSTSSESVRAAAQRAIGRIGGAPMNSDAAMLYFDLGEAYYSERPELTSFPGEEHQLLWYFDPQIGLHMKAIRTPVYHEAMAMRIAERSLRLRPQQGDTGSLALWLAANFSRQIDTPEGYDNPAYPASRREAMYYAAAAGTGPSQAVLARAIDDKDTPLARLAIAAIDLTAGGDRLWGDTANRRPLLEALRYPNRRVQYEAALALGKAQPTAAFDGSERVVPILASAIRDAADRYAVVVAGDNEVYLSLRKVLEGAGYKVLPFGRRLADLAEPIVEAPGIDLAVSSLPSDLTAEFIQQARNSSRLLATPILALTTPQGYVELGRDFERDATVAIRPVGLSEQQIARAAADVVLAASGGPISKEEGRDYASRSVRTLRDLAISGNPVFNVGDAANSLVAALGESSGPMKLEVAEVLARVPQKRAQVAVMDAALNAGGEERVALLGKVADSAKRSGNMLDPRQVQRVIDLAMTGSGEEATAAAALMGALDLPNSNLIPLILGVQK